MLRLPSHPYPTESVSFIPPQPEESSLLQYRQLRYQKQVYYHDYINNVHTLMIEKYIK